MELMQMFPNLSDVQVGGIILMTPFIGLWIWASFISAKAKAFNDGYKRGRQSVRYEQIIK
jgi:hypothetical protein